MTEQAVAPENFVALDELVGQALKEKTPIVGVVDRILDKLEKMGWAYRVNLQPRQVGVHPSNRDGYGLNAEDVHALGRDILAMGWSWNEVQKAVCMEQSPTAKDIEEFNARLASASSLLPPVTPDSIKYGSLSCSHTNMFLRCVAGGVASNDELLATSGQLSLSNLERHDPEFALAVKQGLPWLVLSWRVSERFPGLVTLVQSARNAPGAIARGEHEVQLLVKIQHMASAEQNRTGNAPDWDKISRAVLRSRPPCASEVPGLQIFVALCGGGVKHPFLTDLVSFHQHQITSSDRRVKGQFYKSVAELDLGDAEIPYFKVAMMKAQYSCPPKYVSSGYCGFISTGDVNKCGKDYKKEVVEADNLLREVRMALDAAQWKQKIADTKRCLYLGRLDCMMVRWALKKQTTPEFKTAVDVVNHVLKAGWADVGRSAPTVCLRVALQLRLLGGGVALAIRGHAVRCLTSLHRPWQGMGDDAKDIVDPLLVRWPASVDGSTSVSSAPSASASSGGLKLQEYEGGKSVDGLSILRKKGFDVGSTFVKKGADILLAITDVVRQPNSDSSSVTAFDVHLAGEQEGLKMTTRVSLNEFLAEYTAKSAKEVLVLHSGWPAKVPSASALYLIHLTKSRMSAALAACSTHPMPAVHIYAKPTKTVKAIDSVAKGSLMLTPDTLKISHSEPNGELPHGAVRIHIKPVPDAIKDYKFYLAPTFNDDFVCPAWAVKSVVDEKAANMHWVNVEVSVVQVLELATKRARVSEKQTKAKSEEYQVKVPVLVNRQQIDKDEELCFFQAPAPKKQKITPIAPGSFINSKKQSKSK